MQIVVPNEIYNIITASLNMVDGRLMQHGQRVAYLTHQLLKAHGGYTPREMLEVTALALLHDLGAYKTEEIDRLLEFETINVMDHAIYGYLFLRLFSPFKDTAQIVMYHHMDAQYLPEPLSKNALAAQMIYLCDRVDILMQTQKNHFDETLPGFEPRQFSPQVVRLFKTAIAKEPVLKRLQDGSYHKIVEQYMSQVELPLEQKKQLLRMMAYSIDFRSEFTVIHTMTTVRLSMVLSRLLGCDEQSQEMVYYGSLLHDMGKIGIPIEILEKPGSLTPEEMNLMKTHVELTSKVFGTGLDERVRQISLRHHERMDGSGYPLGLKEEQLTLEEKIVGVADMVSALRSRRSYKDSFPKERIVAILTDAMEMNKLSRPVVTLVLEQYDAIMQEVDVATAPLMTAYQDISRQHVALRQEYQKMIDENQVIPL